MRTSSRQGKGLLHHRGPTFTTAFPRTTALPSRPDRAAVRSPKEPEKNVENPSRKTYLIRADALERREVDDPPRCNVRAQLFDGQRTDREGEGKQLLATRNPRFRHDV